MKSLFESPANTDRHVTSVIRKWKHPALRDPADLNEFKRSANSVYYELEVNDAGGFKDDMETGMGQPTMPVKFYDELLVAMKMDEKSYWNKKASASFTPGYRD